MEQKQELCGLCQEQEGDNQACSPVYADGGRWVHRRCYYARKRLSKTSIQNYSDPLELFIDMLQSAVQWGNEKYIKLLVAEEGMAEMLLSDGIIKGEESYWAAVQLVMDEVKVDWKKCHGLVLRAVKDGPPGIVPTLITKGADPDEIIGGCCALEVVLMKRGVVIAQELLESGADINTRSATYPGILSKFITRKKPAIVEYLLNHGADPTPALHAAVEHGSEKLVKELVQRGADLNCFHPQYGPVLLWVLYYKRNLRDYFINKGADIGARHEGKTILHYAAGYSPIGSYLSYGQYKYLLKNGCAEFLQLADDQGQLPIDIAIAKDNHTFIELLILGNYPSITQEHVLGKHLQFALHRLSADYIKLLLDKNLLRPNDQINGKYPVEIVLRACQDVIEKLELLIACGADLSLDNFLKIACDKRKAKAIYLIYQHRPSLVGLSNENCIQLNSAVRMYAPANP